MNYLRITGHYEEDAEEIIKRVKNTLGSTYMGFSRGPKGRLSEITFPLQRISVIDSFKIIEKIEGLIKPSFAPSNLIQVSVEAE